jgi:hypothetical protein
VGSGFKDFAPGGVLTAADVDGYMMRQSVMTFADATARDSALSGVLDEGMFAYLEDSNSATFYDGTNWQILVEPPQTWSAITTTQSGAVANTVTYAWYQRRSGAFVATATLTLTAAGTITNAITVSTPFTMPAADSIGGSFHYIDQGTTVYAGSILPASTTTFQLQVSGNASPLGVTPNMAIANTDVLHFTIHGRY